MNIRFEPTEDVSLIASVMRHPAIWRHIGDDFTETAEAFEPIIHPHFLYVLVYDDAELLGLFLFEERNGICLEVHTCLLPVSWGDRARKAARLMSGWIFANTRCRRITTTVPSYNRLALRFAKAAGMTQFGCNPLSVQKGGKLYDQLELGISPDPQRNS